MDLIRKFIPVVLYLPFSEARIAPPAINRTALLGTFLYTFTFAHVFIGIVFSFLNKDLYYSYTEEDGYIEYFTAFLLLATSLLCLYKAPRMGGGWAMLFYHTAAAVFFFGFGEEISWGQRIIGFDTPDDLEKINAQQEFNLHNIHVNGINLNKLIFGKVLYTGVFIYYLVLPVLYRRRQWFKQLVDKIRLPLPTPLQTLLYMLIFFSLLLIREGEKWELQEYALASFIFFTFLIPYNRTKPTPDPH